MITLSVIARKWIGLRAGQQAGVDLIGLCGYAILAVILFWTDVSDVTSRLRDEDGGQPIRIPGGPRIMPNIIVIVRAVDETGGISC